MPRPNHGPQITFLQKRGVYYVQWYVAGRERLASLGTADQAEARQKFSDFMERRKDLYPEAKVFTLPVEEMGGVPARRAGTSNTTYFIGGDVGAIKIGIACDVPRRLAALQNGSPMVLKVLAITPGGRDVERAYHYQFRAHRLHGEWFERCSEILAEIERLNAIGPEPDPQESLRLFPCEEGAA